MIPLVVGIAIAAACWGVLFSPWTHGAVNFWAGMLSATGILTAYAVWFSRGDLRRLWSFRAAWVPLGLASAGVLYGVFFAGHAISTAMAGFAGRQIGAIYDMRTGQNPWLIGAALLLWIGPAEEIFWRGFLQHRLAERIGSRRAWLLAALVYAGVHAWSWNLMLILAAALCGLFWGWMFHRWKSLWPVVISHAVWDVTIFLIVPIT